MKEDVLTCSCQNIYESELRKEIKEKGLKTLDDVMDTTTAGTICGACRDDIQVILDEVNGK